MTINALKSCLLALQAGQWTKAQGLLNDARYTNTEFCLRLEFENVSRAISKKQGEIARPKVRAMLEFLEQTYKDCA